MMYRVRGAGLALVFGLALAVVAPQPSQAVTQITAFKQAIAERAADDRDIAAFYRNADFEPLWTGQSAAHEARRAALFAALDGATAHGLPAARYNAAQLRAQLGAVTTLGDLGAAEVALSTVYLRYARDIQTGMIVPSRVDAEIVRKVPYRDRTALLQSLAEGEPVAVMRDLLPKTREYRTLMKHKMLLEADLAQGGWGPQVRAQKLELGQSGPAVIALRNRLMAMGYLPRSVSARYDADMQAAVQRFQAARGLVADGVAGPATLTEVNVTVADRLRSVMVAMERERWLNRDRGTRHILVNLTDFSARILDDDKITFQTRSVIGADDEDRRTPEFSDVMEFMVINPSWFVPRSIATKEYLPALQRNPNAVSHLELTDAQGRVVDRSRVNFARFTERSFPFNMRQPPSQSNALGLVKFMFPNRYNIYLHDTPHKNLFGREVRAYSHGCIRLADPFEFAYALLAVQSDDPKGDFQRILTTSEETQVNLRAPVPVHLIYRTAVTTPRGGIEYRRDVYGRDARIWDAMVREGVALPAVRG